MYSKIALSLILVVAASAAGPAVAVDRFVSTEGVDQGECTDAEPCRTVGFAVGQAVAGDRIVVSAGTYLECVDAGQTLLRFVADTTDGDVILNGAPVCGGTVCADNVALNCSTGSECTGTCNLVGTADGTCSNDGTVPCAEESCEIPDGETTGACADSGAACETDQDCADAQCDFGSCTAVLACSDDGSSCLIDDDCPGGTCDPVPAGPVLRLSSGSSLTGFTVKNGGGSGVVVDGSATIRDNVIEHNFGAPEGGGVYVEPFPTSGGTGAGVAERCWESPTVTCDSAGTNPCSTCDERSALVCTGDAGCVGTCTLADDTDGTCSNDSSASCTQETCVIEEGATVGACTSSLVECSTDQDCADAQCDFGSCAIGSIAPCVSSYLVLLEDNRIRNNRSESYGGGICADLEAGDASETGFVVVTENVIEDNVSTGAGTGDGGGVWARLTGDGDKILRVSDNLIADNVAGAGTGGMTVGTTLASGISEIAIDDNVIEDHELTAATGGALAVVSEFAAGTERISVTGNVVRNNEGPVGGISASVLDPAAGSDVELEIGLNSITHNESVMGGGGLRLEVETNSAADRLAVSLSENTISGNSSESQGGGLWASFGGGTRPVVAAYEITGNTILGNVAEGSGGGVVLDLNGPNNGADPVVDFDHNLVANNVAGDIDTLGGGVLAELSSGGGNVRLNADFNTFVENFSAFGGAGLDLEATSAFGGTVSLTITNSLFQDNQGAGFGGTASGDSPTTVVADYDLFWGNGSPWERTLEPVLSLPNPDSLLFEDPQMSDLYVLDTCSPAVDAADPAADVSLEPEPNGDRANIGYLGGTSRATKSLPDVNGDRQVDGKDVLVLSTAFGAAPGHVRYIPAADLDTNGIVDGDDLAYIGGAFGVGCDASEE